MPYPYGYFKYTEKYMEGDKIPDNWVELLSEAPKLLGISDKCPEWKRVMKELGEQSMYDSKISIDGHEFNLKSGKKKYMHWSVLAMPPEDLEFLRTLLGLPKRNPEPIPNNWFENKKDIAAHLGIKSFDEDFSKLYEDLKSEVDSGRKVQIDGEPLNARFGNKENSKRHRASFSSRDVQLMADKLGLTPILHGPEFPVQILGLPGLTETLGFTNPPQTLKSFYDTIEVSVKNGNVFKVAGVALSARYEKEGANVGQVIFSEKDMEFIRRHCHLPQVSQEVIPDDWFQYGIDSPNKAIFHSDYSVFTSIFNAIDVLIHEGKIAKIDQKELEAKYGKKRGLPNIVAPSFSPDDIEIIKLEYPRIQGNPSILHEVVTEAPAKLKGGKSFADDSLKKALPTQNDLTPNSENTHLKRHDFGRH